MDRLRLFYPLSSPDRALSHGDKMNKKTIAIIISALLFVTVFSAIAVHNFGNRGGGEDETITITDMLGEEVKVPKDPKKVACVSRMTFDLLVALGLGDVIDGAYYSVYNNGWVSEIYPQSQDQYRYAYVESYETFYSRGVDLIFSPEKYITDDLRSHGLTAINISLYGNPNFDADVFYFVDLIEKLWGNREGVSEKVDSWKEQFNEAVTTITSELSKHDDPMRTVYYIRGDKNNGVCYTESGMSFTEYAYRTLGCDDVSVSFGTTTPSVEEICGVDPDVIVIGGVYQNTLKNVLYTEEPWKNLSAVKLGDVYGIPVGLTMFEQMSAMAYLFLYDQANKLYPEYFNFDMSTMLKNAFSEFYNYDLTDEQAYYILHGLGVDGEAMA